MAIFEMFKLVNWYLILLSREFDNTEFVPDHCPYYELYRIEIEKGVRRRHDLDEDEDEDED